MTWGFQDTSFGPDWVFILPFLFSQSLSGSKWLCYMSKQGLFNWATSKHLLCSGSAESVALGCWPGLWALCEPFRLSCWDRCMSEPSLQRMLPFLQDLFIRPKCHSVWKWESSRWLVISPHFVIYYHLFSSSRHFLIEVCVSLLCSCLWIARYESL